MADALKKLVEYLDINPEADWAEVKAEFDKRFIAATPEAVSARKDLHGAVLGKYNGTILTEINRLAKNSLGLEIEENEFAEKSNVEIIRLVGEKFAGAKESSIEELKAIKAELAEAKKTGASSKDVEKLQKEVEAAQLKYNDIKGLHEKTIADFDGYKKTVESERTQWKVDQRKKEALASIKLATKSDFERNGFLAELDKKYKIEFEGDDEVVRDAKTNERVANPSAAGKFMSYADVLKYEAKEAKLLDENPHSNKPAARPNIPAITTDNPQTQGRRPSLFKAVG